MKTSQKNMGGKKKISLGILLLLTVLHHCIWWIPWKQKFLKSYPFIKVFIAKQSLLIMLTQIHSDTYKYYYFYWHTCKTKLYSLQISLFLYTNTLLHWNIQHLSYRNMTEWETSLTTNHKAIPNHGKPWQIAFVRTWGTPKSQILQIDISNTKFMLTEKWSNF